MTTSGVRSVFKTALAVVKNGTDPELKLPFKQSLTKSQTSVFTWSSCHSRKSGHCGLQPSKKLLSLMNTERDHNHKEDDL
jgi:hypothetical protein